MPGYSLHDQPTPPQRQGMRNAIITQCFGTLGQLAFTNGLLLVYFTAQGMGSSRIVLYLAVPMLADTFLRVPAAYYADRYGKKLAGITGNLLQVLGFGALTAAGICSGGLCQALLALGVIVFSIGNTVMSSSWFGLLDPVVPGNLRGRFFGTLRFSWQVVGFLFAAGYSLFLGQDSPLSTFLIILGLVTVSLLLRSLFYLRVPELERPVPPRESLIGASITVLRADGFMSYCAYLFLISLFTANCPTLFGLLEKEVLHFGDSQVVWMGNLMMIGSVLGFLAAGRIIDRWSTKPVFVLCHFGYGAVLCLFLARGMLAGPLLVAGVGALNLLFGVFTAMSSIAITAETLNLIPALNKSLSTSIANTLARAGGAFAGLISAWVLDHHLLSDTWTLHGAFMSRYDTLLLGSALMVVLLVVTLGLIPSVLKKPARFVEQEAREVV